MLVRWGQERRALSSLPGHLIALLLLGFPGLDECYEDFHGGKVGGFVPTLVTPHPFGGATLRNEGRLPCALRWDSVVALMSSEGWEGPRNCVGMIEWKCHASTTVEREVSKAATPSEILDNVPDGIRRQMPDEVVDELPAAARTRRSSVPGGVLAHLTKRLVERPLEVELTDHVGYERHQEGPGRGGTRTQRVDADVLDH